MVELRGIEPLTPLLAKQVLSQLSYSPIISHRFIAWCIRLGSNQRPLPCQGSALPLSYERISAIISANPAFHEAASRNLTEQQKCLRCVSR